MPKKTLSVIIFLALVATLLLGINLGKKLATSQYLSQFAPTPTPITPNPSPTLSPFPPTITSSQNQNQQTQNVTNDTDVSVQNGTSTYTDRSCGFTISYTGSYLEQNSENGKSTIITNPDNPQETIITACQTEIPKPPLPPEKIENITLDGVPAKLYHDTSSQDGSPRDEVIATHPSTGQEIIIAGYGTAFNQAVSSFKFLR